MLKLTKVELELFTDIVMVLFWREVLEAVFLNAQIGMQKQTTYLWGQILTKILKNPT